MSKIQERFTVYVSSEQKKLLRWNELAQTMPRGYLNQITGKILSRFLATGEVLKIGTVNSNLCKTKSAKRLSILFSYCDTDTVVSQGYDCLREETMISSFVNGLLERAIEEGTEEHLLSTWEIQASILDAQRQNIQQRISSANTDIDLQTSSDTGSDSSKSEKKPDFGSPEQPKTAKLSPVKEKNITEKKTTPAPVQDSAIKPDADTDDSAEEFRLFSKRNNQKLQELIGDDNW